VATALPDEARRTPLLFSMTWASAAPDRGSRSVATVLDPDADERHAPSDHGRLALSSSAPGMTGLWSLRRLPLGNRRVDETQAFWRRMGRKKEVAGSYSRRLRYFGI
jgi:hypothetical protein